ncbi:hypothetical protein GA0070624_2775 [Micromonospora rhizosphaerae]|uniref:Uncharacterized protein n=1 Tax=Micromonospora rhizosphaerae TaxID=568872 RepID=A0A1C6S2M1_9ACTN|nr:hypothetical protein [Micromonospora rhizosphaerae]SCL23648.1 hypothetical protein GA0070624_2775 [Micromonospora rhizosphaerae]
MTQADENREKTAKTDALLMRPGNDPHRYAGQEPPPRERGETRVERDGQMVPVKQEE